MQQGALAALLAVVLQTKQQLIDGNLLQKAKKYDYLTSCHQGPAVLSCNVGSIMTRLLMW